MIVTLTGVNDWARKRELDELVSDFVLGHTDMAVERFDGEENSCKQMTGGLQSLPFLTARKLVVLREPGKQKAFAENIADILKNIADTTDVIVVEPKLDKRLNYYKTLKKVTDFREFAEMDGGGLSRWAVEYAVVQGGSLSAPDARLLVDRLGASQQLLKSELDKLLAFDPSISRKNIETLTELTPQSTVFELLDAAFAGNSKRALELYKEQRALKVEPQAILAMLVWQVHILAVVKAGAPRSADEIAKEAKMSPFVVRKSQNLVRNRSLNDIKKMVSDLLELDAQLKSTAINADEALQLFLLKLVA